MRFEKCRTEVEKNIYKRSGALMNEYDEWAKVNCPEFYNAQHYGDYNDVLDQICKNIQIPQTNERFLYFIDYRFLFDTRRGYRFENLTPDYQKILQNGLESMKYCEEQLTNEFTINYNRTVDSMIALIDRIIEKETDEKRIVWFQEMKKEPAKDLESAIQRILFVNQLFWQMGHRLIGLGRLDQLLFNYCKEDLLLGKEKITEILSDFMYVLHKYYWLKSNVLMGDTGQIIILGGTTIHGEDQSNELTEIIIDVITKLQLPDPKVLLRVGKNTPRAIIAKALCCINTGVGSPIFANDDIIIPHLIGYGIEEGDAYDYGTSACWEPLIPGKSMSPNNVAYLKYPEALQRLLEDSNIDKIENFNEFINRYFEFLQVSICEITEKISAFRFQYNTLLSLFMGGCYERKRDVSEGGAIYSNYGITTVGLSNTVNSLLNIKLLVFEKKQYKLSELRHILVDNFENNDYLKKQLKNAEMRFGRDDLEVIQITNQIMSKTSDYTHNFTNYLGGGLKFGVSAPSYVDAAKGFPASMDGRLYGEPFGVHISCESNNGYTEIINFASKLDYGENRFNGNVVDLIVSPSFIESNFDKMVDLVMASISIGFFELQMNVVSSKVLIDAKANPDKYPTLIVRVWGFSAYFNELPESYQNIIIQRALENERRVS